jgi:hypothetical protein
MKVAPSRIRCSRILVEATNHWEAAKHFDALMKGSRPAKAVVIVKSYPGLFYTRAQLSGRYWMFTFMRR